MERLRSANERQLEGIEHSLTAKTRNAIAALGVPLLDVTEGAVEGAAYVAGRAVGMTAKGARQLFNGLFRS